MKKLLLQACCGPCATYALEVLSQKYQVTVFFWGSNIHPREEYDRRLEAIKKVSPQAIIVPYNKTEFLNAIKGLENEPEGGARCARCFELRLRATAEYAKAHGFDYFASSLTISPHKDIALINKIGTQFEKYLPTDFRAGFQKSIELSKKLGIYRQNYCGCTPRLLS